MYCFISIKRHKETAGSFNEIQLRDHDGGQISVWKKVAGSHSENANLIFIFSNSNLIFVYIENDHHNLSS